MPISVPPLVMLGSLLALTGVAWFVYKLVRGVRRRKIRRLAEEWRMRYAERDPFQLAQRVAGALPVPGAADLRVMDVVYCSEGDWHRYVFTAEYTRGVVGRHEREQRVMTFAEPREPTPGSGPTPVVCGPAEASIVEQYVRLRELVGNEGGS